MAVMKFLMLPQVSEENTTTILETIFDCMVKIRQQVNLFFYDLQVSHLKARHSPSKRGRTASLYLISTTKESNTE